MDEIIKYLHQSKTQYFATIGLDGKPKVRPFQFMLESEGKLWFCTSNRKEVFKELQKQPYFEICASLEGMSWMRIQGRVVFSDSLEVKKKIFDKSPLVKGIYKVPENPEFEVFYLSEATASVSEIGKTPNVIALR